MLEKIWKTAIFFSDRERVDRAICWGRERGKLSHSPLLPPLMINDKVWEEKEGEWRKQLILTASDNI